MTIPSDMANRDMFLEQEAQLQRLLTEHPRLQDIEEALDRFGASHYDRREQAERNHARYRVLKLVHALYRDLGALQEQLQTQAVELKARETELIRLRPLCQQQLHLPDTKTD